VTDDRHSRLSGLFHAASALHGAERDRFLAESCAGEDELRREIESLLDEEEAADRLFNTPAARIPAWLSTATTRSGADDTRELFTGLAPPVSELLLGAMYPSTFDAGVLLVRQGDPGDYLLYLTKGSAAAHLRHKPATIIGEFGPGDVVGEMSLVTNEPRMADVVARTPVEALRLDAGRFRELAERYPELGIVLTNIMASRLGHSAFDGFSDKVLHGYQIVRPVGRGGMSVVYEAADANAGKTVALKMMSHRLLYEPKARRRFYREVEVLKSLRHPSIASLYDHFEAYRTHFLVMEFCPGITLDRYLSDRGTLDESEVRRLLGQLAETLAYVHGQGLVHRDIKPSNIMLGPNGRLKLLDFGLAKWHSPIHPTEAHDPISSRLSIAGTPRYMAPEQCAGQTVDHRADVYSMAVVAYEALSGSVPCDGADFVELVERKRAFALQPAGQIGRGISADLHRFLTLGLAPDPERRCVSLDQISPWAGPIAGTVPASADRDHLTRGQVPSDADTQDR